jgi:signal transduction histidine kinase
VGALIIGKYLPVIVFHGALKEPLVTLSFSAHEATGLAVLDQRDDQDSTRDLAFSNLVNMTRRQGLDPDEYRAVQLSAVKRTTPHMMIANVMAAMLVSWVAWPTAIGPVVLLWALVISSVSIFMLLTGWLRSRRRRKDGSGSKREGVRKASPQAARKAEIYAVLLGVIWGSLPAASFEIAPASVNLIIMGVVMGACGLGSFNLSRFPSAALLYSSILTSSLVGSAFAIGNRGGIAIAFLGTIYGVALAAMILKQHQQALQRASDQKNLEQQNEIIKLLLRDFETGTRDWLWETDAEGRLRYASERLGQLVNRPMEDLLGQPFQDIIADNGTMEGWSEFASLIARQRPVEGIEAALVVGSDITWWQVNAEPSFAGDKTFNGYRGVAVDITEAKRSSEQMLQAVQAAERANVAKSQFLAVISHELRTPLNSIVGYAELANSPKHDEDRGEYLGNILDHSRHLSRLISDILDITRIERGTMELLEQEVDLDELVEVVVKMCQVQAGEGKVTLVDDIQFRGMLIRGDQTRLKQILINIISNAVKFTPEGGRVDVTVTLDAGGRPLIEVRDTGIGVEPEKLAAIFEPFVQADQTKSRHYEGAGLGAWQSRASWLGCTTAM